MKVLFIHHGDHKGGAPLSMLYTMLAIRDRGYHPVVGLAIPTPELKKLYGDHQIETIDMTWIRMIYFWSANPMQWWKPSTYITIAKALEGRSNRDALTHAILIKYKIDIVHLNSVSLFTVVPFLKKINFPFVWHIREHAPKSGSLIFSKIKSLMHESRDLIFLTEEEQISWLGDKTHGTVVYNFVSKEKFDFSMDVTKVREQLNLTQTDKIILYLGGFKPHKGVDVLINTLHKLKSKYPDLKCIMPDSVIYSGNTKNWKTNLRKKSFADLMIERIIRYNLQDNCIRIPFDTDAQKYFAVTDLVVFPALTPHFARPVIEAAIMKKPVIVSDWPVLLEVVEPNVTGLVVRPNDESELFDKIDLLFSDEALRNRLAENAYQYAVNKFTADAQIQKIINMYELYSVNKHVKS